MFLDFHTSKFGLKFFLLGVLGILAILAVVIAQISSQNYLLVALTFLALLGFFFLKFIKPIKNVSSDFKSKQIKEKQLLTFEFFDDFFIITKKNKEFKKYYTNVYKVFEVKHFFYIYISKHRCFILEKSGFINSDINKFYTFLDTKCTCKKEI